MAGEAGAISLAGKLPEGDAAIAPELAVYKSSDPKIVAVDEKTGAFRAVAPGDAVVTVAHPAAADAAAVKIRVAQRVAPPREGAPSVVKVLSDQGPAVSFAVGTNFDDFRVVAEYPNGLTRLVTKRATIRTTQPPDQAPITASGGRLLGVHPGQTVVQGEFDGVYSQQGLAVTVTSQIEADEIRVLPSPATLLPGETLALDAVGFKAGKSIGSLSGLSALSFKGDGEAIHVAGARVTGREVGHGHRDGPIRQSRQPAGPGQRGGHDCRPAYRRSEELAHALGREPAIGERNPSVSRRARRKFPVPRGLRPPRRGPLRSGNPQPDCHATGHFSHLVHRRR